MPVGQAVIAISVFGLAAAGFSAGAAGFGFSAGLSTSSTRPTTSSALDASRRDCTNSLRTSARARLDSSFMCSAPPASGAAMRNARSAGPSGAPKSTGGCSRANPIDAVSTCGERQCGIAMPPGSPVADCSSRAIAAEIRPSASLVRPASARLPTRRAMTACLSAPASTSSRTRLASMMGREAVLVMAILSVGCYELAEFADGIDEIGVTRTASRSISAGVGSAEPGRAAAALP